MNEQVIWCKHHWNNVVWPRVEAGQLISLSLTMDLNASVFHSQQFKDFRRGFDNDDEAVDAFMQRYAPLCCLMGDPALEQLMSANTPEALRKRRPKDAEKIIKQDKTARKRGMQ